MNSYFPFISYVFIMTFTPGPNNLMSMIHGTKFGYRKTLSLMLGIFSGFFILMLTSSFFNIVLYRYIPIIKPYMKILAAVYMFYIAYLLLKPQNHKKKDKSPSIATYKTGLLLQIVNVKVILYCITVTSTFIIPYVNNIYLIIASSFFIAFIAFLSVNAWALFGSFFNQYMEKYEKPINIFMSLLLIYTALMITGVL